MISCTPTSILQSNEYYPYGLTTANSWTRDNITGNNFLGNGGTELNTTSQLYDLEYRNYDPVLGRMNGVDPMASKYSSLSPYNFSFNDPVSFNDPSGADPLYNETTRASFGESMQGGYFRPHIIDAGNGGGGHIYPGSGGNWADGLRSMESNLGLMNASTFRDFYAIHDDQSRFEAGKQLSSGSTLYGSGASATWSMYGAGYNVLYATNSLGRLRGVFAAKLRATDINPSPVLSIIAQSLEESEQDVVTQQDLLNYVSSHPMNSSKYSGVQWILDSKGQKTSTTNPGETISTYRGSTLMKVIVYIHPSAFGAFTDNRQFLVIGHELIHVMHNIGDTYLKWAIDNRDWKVADNISEYYAYKWTVDNENRLGYTIGGQLGLDKYTRLLPTGY